MGLLEDALARVAASADSAIAVAKAAAEKKKAVAQPQVLPGAVEVPPGGRETLTPPLSGVETAMFTPKPGAVEAPVGEPALVAAVKNKPVRRNSRSRNPAVGGDATAQSAGVIRGRVKRSAVTAPASGDTSPARPDMVNGGGEVSDTKKQEFLLAFNAAFEDLKKKIADAPNIDELMKLKRPGKEEMYRFFNLDNFADYLNSLQGTRSEKERKDVFERIETAEKELERLYRLSRGTLKKALPKSGDNPKGEKLPDAELQRLRERWLKEIREAITTATTIDELKSEKLTKFFDKGRGRKIRDFILPEELIKILSKGAPKDTKDAFSAELKGLMELWRGRVVDVYFDQPDVKEKFVKFLSDSFQALHKGRLDKTKFISQYQKEHGVLAGIEDLKDCDVLKDKLDELYVEQFSIIEAAQRGGKAGSVELSEAETEERSKKWLEEIREQILASSSLAALKSLTHINDGGSRRINLPLDFRLYRKDAPPETAQAIQRDLGSLLDLWREQMADVLLNRPAEELFIDRLGAAYDHLADKKMTQKDFYEEFLGSRKFDFTDIGDMRRCAAMKKKLGGLWDTYYPAVETAVNESQLAILIAALKKKEKSLGKGRDGKEFTVLEVSDTEQLLRVNYDGLVRKFQPKNIDVVFRYLQKQHDWSPERELVSASKRKPEERASQELNMLHVIVDARKKRAVDLQAQGKISERQCGYFVRHLDNLVRMTKLAIDDEEYDEVSRIIEKASQAIILPEKLIPQAQVITEKPVITGAVKENKRELRVVGALGKQKEKWLKRIKNAETKEKFDAVTEEAKKNGFSTDVPNFVGGAYWDSLRIKNLPATAEEREKLTKLVSVFQDEISETYLRKGGEYYPEMRERMDLIDSEKKEKGRTYKELMELMDQSEIDELAGITGTGLKLALVESRSTGKTKQAVIDELGGVDVVAEKALAPAVKLALPSDWSDAEREAFSLRFSQDRVKLFVQVKSEIK